MSSPRRAAVLGHPVAHSLSPVLHQAAYHALDLPQWHYQRFDVDEPDLAGFLAGLGPDWAGLSLTMPLKQVALPLMDHLEPLAEVVGAVNTVLLPGSGVRVGTNTDVYGMVTALGEVADPKWAPRRGVILGGGATAASALAALGQFGIRQPVVIVRSMARAGAVVRAGSRMGLEPQLVTWGSPRADAALVAAEAVIATPPAGGADGLAEQVRRAQLHTGQVLLDVVYDGWPTPIASAWSAAGGRIAGGDLMLLHQAVEQVRLMTGRTAPVVEMRAALGQALGEGHPH